MKKLKVLKLAWSIISLISIFMQGKALVVICRSKRIVQEFEGDRMILKVFLEDGDVNVFRIDDGKIYKQDLLAGLNSFKNAK